MAAPTPPADEAATNPLEAVFEKAVHPFADAQALRASLPPSTPIVAFKKNDQVPTQTRQLEGGATLTIPVLGAIQNSSVAGWKQAGDFDFSTLEADAVALLVEERADGAVDLRVVTRAEGGAFLVADLGGMLDALKTLLDNPAFRAFPGGTFLIDALQTGLEAARADLTATLRAKGPGGAPGLLEQFKAAASRSGERRPSKGGKKHA